MQKGAYLVIEHTEALHVIDVNSGNRSNKAKSQEQTALEVNLIAAEWNCRTIKIERYGRYYCVDFIDLNSNENRKKLFEHLRKEMESDRTKHKILPPSRFGLIQITRQRFAQMILKHESPIRIKTARLKLQLFNRQNQRRAWQNCQAQAQQKKELHCIFTRLWCLSN